MFDYLDTIEIVKIEDYCEENGIDLDDAGKVVADCEKLLDDGDFYSLQKYLKLDLGKDRVVSARIEYFDDIESTQIDLMIRLYKRDYTYTIDDVKEYSKDNKIDLNVIKRLVKSKDYVELKSYMKLPIEKDIVTNAYFDDDELDIDVEFYEKTIDYEINKNPFVIVDDELVRFELSERDLSFIGYRVEIPEGVKRIGDNVFKDSKVECVVLPSTIESIGMESFKHCTNLERVVLNDGIKEIGDSAFKLCLCLKFIKFPSSLTTIGKFAFSFCYNLEEVVLPESVTLIGEYAFSFCNSLKEVKGCESLEVIESDAFLNCSNLENIILPLGLKKIGMDSFKGCEKLSSVTLSYNTIIYDEDPEIVDHDGFSIDIASKSFSKYTKINRV